jgi:glycosyltransferase involved in cell wall biosynthesis
MIRVHLDIRRTRWHPQVGISRYARSLLRAMRELDPTDVAVLPIDLGTQEQPGRSALTIGEQHGYLQRFHQEQVTMARLSRRADVLHLPWYEGPALPRCPLVVTVFDLDTLERPDGYSLRFRAYYNTLLRVFIRRAARILVSSHASRDALAARWPNRPYVVVPLGIDDVFRETSNGGEPVQESPFILYPGGFGGRKRVTDLLAAFDAVRSRHRDMRLLITGQPPPALDPQLRVALGRPGIEMTGYLEDEALAAAYRHAAVVAYPSALEGFGFPIVEAFASGTPVVACRAGSIPEVAGDAAALVTPGRPDQLADALLGVLEDDALARELRRRGRIRAQDFRWSRTASATLDVYREASREG